MQRWAVRVCILRWARCNCCRPRREPIIHFGDYKALVCVFLYGGNDSFNTVVPYSIAGNLSNATPFKAFYGTNGVRPALALTRSQMTNTVLNAATSGAGSPGDGNTYALHPAMAPQLITGTTYSADLATTCNAGNAAIIANVGTLVGPVMQSDYQAGSVALPPQLYSHADQQEYWQSSPPTNQPVTGWGGRIADLVASANSSNIPILTGLNGQDAFMRGQNVNGYVMNSNGASTLQVPYDPASDGTGLQNVFNALFAAGTQANVLEQTNAATMNHSIATAGLINTAIGGAPHFRCGKSIPDGSFDRLRYRCSIADGRAADLGGESRRDGGADAPGILRHHGWL